MHEFPAQTALAPGQTPTRVLLAMVLLALAVSGCNARPKHETPDVQLLTAPELKSRLSQLREPLTVVHVWATTCVPCGEEFPRLMRFREAYAGRGVPMILVSADPPAQKARVANYLAERGALSPSYIIDNPNESFIDVLCTNWSGGMPASFFFGPGGELRQWWEGKAEYEKYRTTADALLKQTSERR